jgi:hypothetical protein
VDLKGVVDRVKGIFAHRGEGEAATRSVAKPTDIAASNESPADTANDAADASKDPGGS